MGSASKAQRQGLLHRVSIAGLEVRSPVELKKAVV